MVYVVWYENNRRVFYEVTRLRNFLRTVPLSKVKVFEQDAFGNMIPIDPNSLFVGRTLKPPSDLYVNSEDKKNIGESGNRTFIESDREILSNSLNTLNNIQVESFNRKNKSFVAFMIRIILIILGIIIVYLILPSLIRAIFS